MLGGLDPLSSGAQPLGAGKIGGGLDMFLSGNKNTGFYVAPKEVRSRLCIPQYNLFLLNVLVFL